MTRQNYVLYAVLAVAACVLVALASRHAGQFLPLLIVAAALLLCMFPMIRRCLALWPRAKYSWIRGSVRGLRWLRAFYRPTPGGDFMASAGIVLGLVCFMVFMVTHSMPLYQEGMALLVPVMAGVGAAECLQRTRRLWREAWAKSIGKIGMSGLAVVVGVIAHTIAAHMAFSVNAMDPKYSANFVALLTALLIPVFYVYAFSVLISVWSLLEFTLFMLLAAFGPPLRNLAGMVGIQRRFDNAVYRIAYGRRPGSESKREIFEDGIVFVFRTSSMIVFVVGFWAVLGQFTRAPTASVDSMMRRAMVATDYQQGPLCQLDPTGYYLPTDGKSVSVARKVGDNFTFDRATCL